MDIKIIVGYAGSGKSYLAEQYRKKGYFIVSCDEIIKEHLMKDSSDTVHFGIYEKNINKKLSKSANKFILIIKKIIKQHKKVIIEGQLKNIDMINKIVGKNKYTIILTKPRNKSSYVKHLISRFVNNPANYGRIGILEVIDNRNGRIALNDYIRNGMNGRHIKKLIKDGADARYCRHEELHDYYRNNFQNLVVKLT